MSAVGFSRPSVWLGISSHVTRRQLNDLIVLVPITATSTYQIIALGVFGARDLVGETPLICASVFDLI